MLIKYVETKEDLNQVHLLRKKAFVGKFPGREFFIDHRDLKHEVILMFNNDTIPIGTVRLLKNGADCKLEMIAVNYAGYKGFVCLTREIVAYCESGGLTTLSADTNTEHVAMWSKMGAVAGEEFYLDSVGVIAVKMTAKVSDFRRYLDKLKVRC